MACFLKAKYFEIIEIKNQESLRDMKENMLSSISETGT